MSVAGRRDEALAARKACRARRTVLRQRLDARRGLSPNDPPTAAATGRWGVMVGSTAIRFKDRRKMHPCSIKNMVYEKNEQSDGKINEERLFIGLKMPVDRAAG